ncbi:hypothetical protein DCC85_13965 [Paenibacillus sp. CAA11]|uniref:DUF3949 domain-containing protein n=1 Tax=Paenibacillus sp. CAA11 TaxID=1532905 RepID=UPI000D34D3CE|nr:DUF3949 domain-containing protein [Paenibacillus sp. CAA11]AWB45224.1 hypothetical protein DCC85_13965 [Paenibacillus sp. CAA11]
MLWFICLGIGVYLLINAAMIPVQYSYIGELRKRQQSSGKSQQELYQDMPFGEEQLHAHQQGAFWPASIVAGLIYKRKHGVTKV